MSTGILSLFLTIASGIAVDRLMLKFAQNRHTMSPQISMAAAMAGLFAAGLVGLLTIVILFRSGSAKS